MENVKIDKLFENLTITAFSANNDEKKEIYNDN